MQTRPRLAVLISLFTALVTALVLTSGCSSDKKSSEPLPDAATLLKDSTATTKAQQSAHLVITVTGEIKKLPITSLTGDLTNTPAVAASGKADITALGNALAQKGFDSDTAQRAMLAYRRTMLPQNTLLAVAQ